ncbi:MAG: peptidase MA family metallohydrolase [Isosphaerales bacterium]
MRQAVTTMIVGILLALAPLTRAGDGGTDATGSIAQARRLIEAKDHASATMVLEDLLLEARAKDKAAILDLLRQSYTVLARQAQGAGRERDAAHYRDNLAILDQGHPGTIPAESTEQSRKQTPGTQAGVKPTAGASNDATAPAKAQPPLPAKASKIGPEPDRTPALFPEPAPLSEPPKMPAPSSTRLPPPRSASPSSPAPSLISVPGSPAPGNHDPDRGDPDLAVAAPAPARGAPTPSTTGPKTGTDRTADPRRPLARPTPEEADRLFSLKQYAEAGRCYSALARENQLPANRKNHWAYCRMVDVALRMNARPRSSRDWDVIDAEIQSIQRLAPNLWYGEYLRNKFAEVRQGRRRPRAQADDLVVRASAPDESQSQPRRFPKLFSQPSLESNVGRAGDESTAPTGVAWQVHETPNFRIFHCDPRLAESAGQAAESVRADQAKRWGSPALQRPWTPRCEIHLYPTGRAFAQATGQPESSPGFSTMFSNGNRVTARRTSLRADHPQLLTAILPHEITHVVLADLFTVQQIPRWADEGIAVLAEPKVEQNLRAAELQEPLESGQVFDLGKLMSMDYPEAKDWSLYYAQSVSLTRFLVDQGTPERFLQFVHDLHRTGIEAALRDGYRINGFAELKDRWQEYARQQLATLKGASTSTSP